MQQTDVSARQRLVDAAIESISEVGYYRASSNKIAERAGLTWGVIQHHFGTRDELLLEVVRQSAQHLTSTLAEGRIEGETVPDRLMSLADVVWGHYRRPEFLVVAQIIMNLSRDPSTAASTLEALDSLTAPTLPLWQSLVDQAVDPVDQPDGFAAALYRIMRGVAVGDELLDSMAAGDQPSTEPSNDARERELLIGALTSLVTEG